jgi:hypothetical protein
MKYASANCSKSKNSLYNLIGYWFLFAYIIELILVIFLDINVLIKHIRRLNTFYAHSYGSQLQLNVDIVMFRRIYKLEEYRENNCLY